MEIVLDYKNDRFEMNSGYDFRHIPKEAKFQWDPDMKVWHTSDPVKAAKLKNYANPTALDKLDRLILGTLDKSQATTSGIDVTWPKSLKSYPFQNAGIEWAMNHSSTLIADEMGLGKTIQAIGVINQAKAKKVLVICPAAVKINWKRELAKWLVEPLKVALISGQSVWEDANVYVLNYDILKNFDAQIKGITWDVLIMDEVHYLKNSKTQRAKNIFGKWNRDKQEWTILPVRAKRKVALTGTPICNRPKELWSVVHYLCPQTFKNWRKFHERYANLQITRWGMDISGASNLDELQILLRSSCMIRRLKNQVLTELPAKVRQVIELDGEGDPKVTALLKKEKALLNKYSKTTKNSESIVITEEATKQLKNDVNKLTGITEAFTELALIRHELALAKVSYVLDFISELDGKVIIFAHHRDVIEAIVNALGDKAVKLTGSDSLESRQTAIDRFQTDDSVQFFVGSIQACGVGITLTSASHVIFAEQSWEPGSVCQAEDRAHRMGQKNSVLVQHLVFDNSLDAHMIQTVIKKQEIIDKALDSGSEDYYVPVDPTIEETAKKKQGHQKPEESITEEQINLVHLGLRRLAGLCDGARSEDGMGFNKFDTKIGKQWAIAPTLSKKMAIAARKMLKKYHGQLGEDFIKSLG